MRPNDTGTITNATKVISQLIVNIMISTPSTVVTDVMIWERLWLRVWLTVSTSFVIRESISPWLGAVEVAQRHAVYFLGNILAEPISDIHDTPDMIQPCT